LLDEPGVELDAVAAAEIADAAIWPMCPSSFRRTAPNALDPLGERPFRILAATPGGAAALADLLGPRRLDPNRLTTVLPISIVPASITAPVR